MGRVTDLLKGLAVAKDLSKRLSKRYGDQPFPPGARKRIFENLLTTPEREEMYRKSEDAIERFLQGNEPPGYLFGSFASEKPTPGDIDIMATWPEKFSWSQGPIGDEVIDTLLAPRLKGYDAKRFLDPIIEEGRARYGPGYNLIRILGLGTLLSTALEPDEAEAGKIKVGQIVKSMGEALPESSASKVLKGLQILGREIESVLKGKGDRRIIRFTDGYEVPVDKSYINELSAAAGTKRYMNLLESKPEEGQIEQALKSLEFHRRRAKEGVSPQQKAGYVAKRKQALDKLEAGEYHTDYVLVEAGPTMEDRFYMPKPYAEILEKIGEVKIRRKK